MSIDPRCDALLWIVEEDNQRLNVINATILSHDSRRVRLRREIASLQDQLGRNVPPSPGVPPDRRRPRRRGPRTRLPGPFAPAIDLGIHESQRRRIRNEINALQRRLEQIDGQIVRLERQRYDLRANLMRQNSEWRRLGCPGI